MASKSFPAGSPVKFDSPSSRFPTNAAVKPGGKYGSHIVSPALEEMVDIHEDGGDLAGSGGAKLATPSSNLKD